MQRKKVLIITYYWPPAGGPGVQRWLKFCKYLQDFGWEPTVYIPDNPSYPIVDETLLNEVPKDITIIKNKIWEPYQWAEKLNKNNKKYKAGQFDVKEKQNWKSKLSIWVRGNFFIPDARVFWVKPSVKFLKKHLKTHSYDALITTGPPHSMHIIGLKLKQIFPKLKWIADFRDPWIEISYYKHLKLTKLADQKHRKLEKKVFENADITLATSFTDAENFKNKGANAVCITNGFDTESLENLNEIQTQKFTISYVGVLEQLRNPKIFWEILNEIVEKNENFRQDFQLKFVGHLDNNILQELNETSLNKNIKILGYLSHNQALKEMNSSTILLLTNFPERQSKGIIPGKIFEYLAMKKVIISFGYKNSDVAKILEETRAGKHFSFNEKQPTRDFILSQYQDWKDGKSHQKTKNIEAFSRKYLTEKLVNILENI